MKQIIYLLCLVLALVCLNASAAVINSTPSGNTNVVSSAINTPSAFTLTHGDLWINLRNDYYGLQQFSNTQLANYAQQTNQTIESDEYYNLTSITAAYGLTKGITLGLNIPNARLANIRTGSISNPNGFPLTTISELGNSKGLRDIALFAQILLFQDKSQFSGMLTAGSTIPTGATHDKDNLGNLFPPGDQPGRGTFAPYLGITITKTMDKAILSANMSYIQGFKGAQNSNLGNTFEYNLAYIRQLYQSNSHFIFDGILELNGGYYTKIVTNGVAGANSGGQVLQITPALRMTTPGKISPYISASVPLSQSLNGIQSKQVYQITCGVDMTI